MSRLRVAVIGAGNIAQRHLPVLGGSPDCEVAVLCDANPAILAETAQRFTAPGAGGAGAPEPSTAAERRA
jgi:predicted dehydrogenase